jgi:hypothetical protein
MRRLRLLSLWVGLLAIKDNSGNVALAYQVSATATPILLSSPALNSGTSYTLYSGGSLNSRSENFHKLYLNPSVYSGGTSLTSFSISSVLTTLTL